MIKIHLHRFKFVRIKTRKVNRVNKVNNLFTKSTKKIKTLLKQSKKFAFYLIVYSFLKSPVRVNPATGLQSKNSISLAFNDGSKIHQEHQLEGEFKRAIEKFYQEKDLESLIDRFTVVLQNWAFQKKLGEDHIHMQAYVTDAVNEADQKDILRNYFDRTIASTEAFKDYLWREGKIIENVIDNKSIIENDYLNPLFQLHKLMLNCSHNIYIGASFLHAVGNLDQSLVLYHSRFRTWSLTSLSITLFRMVNTVNFIFKEDSNFRDFLIRDQALIVLNSLNHEIFQAINNVDLKDIAPHRVRTISTSLIKKRKSVHSSSTFADLRGGNHATIRLKSRTGNCSPEITKHMEYLKQRDPELKKFDIIDDTMVEVDWRSQFFD